MPFEVSWYQEKQVIYQHIWGDVTLDDVAGVSRDQSRMLHEGTVPIHAIIDISEVESFPTDLRDLKAALTGVDYPNLGWVIIVGMKTSMQRFVTTVVAKVVLPSAKLRMLNTMDEVEPFLRHIENLKRLSHRQQDTESPLAS